MLHIIPFQLIYPEEIGCHILVDAKVNDIPAKFIIDTGASNTVMDMSRIEKFVVSPNMVLSESMSASVGSSNLTSHVLIINQLSIDTFSVRDYMLILMDLSHINHVFTSLKLGEVDGILGGDLFLKYKAKIDYKYKTLTFRTRN